MGLIVGRGNLSRVRFTAYVIIAICALVMVYFFWVRGMRFFMVPSSSMEPTLYPYDHLLTLKAEEYRPGDIVVVRDFENTSEYFVKRIIALEGDTVSIYAGVLHINEKYVSEPYVMEPMTYVLDEYTVSEGEVFLLGDNRNNSEDSSLWEWDWDEGDPRPGIRRTIPRRYIVGKVRRLYFPFHRRGPVRSYPLQPVPS